MNVNRVHQPKMKVTTCLCFISDRRQTRTCIINQIFRQLLFCVNISGIVLYNFKLPFCWKSEVFCENVPISYVQKCVLNVYKYFHISYHSFCVWILRGCFGIRIKCETNQYIRLLTFANAKRQRKVSNSNSFNKNYLIICLI